MDQDNPNWLDSVTGGVVFTPGNPAVFEKAITAANLVSGASYYILSKAIDEVANEEGSGNWQHGQRPCFHVHL